jgi:uncharacterized protein (DUF4415 family)
MTSNDLLFLEPIGSVGYWWFVTHGAMMSRFVSFQRVKPNRTNANRMKGEYMKTNYDFSQGKRGAVIPTTGKTRITIYLDDDVLDAFRTKANAEGKGYQTMINDVLRKAMVAVDSTPVTVEVLRQIIREELHAH